jgi:hypothetical protein
MKLVRGVLIAALMLFLLPGCQRFQAGSPESDADDAGDGVGADEYSDSGYGDVGDARDAGMVSQCTDDENCGTGFLCLEPSGEFPATDSTVWACGEYDGTFEDGPVVGQTGCSQENLVDVDVWGFCDQVLPTIHDGDVVRGSVCGPDRIPAYKYSVEENTRVEFYLTRADRSLGVFGVQVYESNCTFRGASGGIPLDNSAHHGPIELGFMGPGDYTLVIASDFSSDGTGSFNFHFWEVGTFDP